MNLWSGLMATDRRFKHDWFRRAFDTAKIKDKVISRKKMIAQFCLDCGSTERTAKEILDVYISASAIKIEGDDIIIL